jgi:phenylalanyl-tRNA synthetase alpha chain
VTRGGCGMVDSNLFGAVGIDCETYTGWAFGFGIERLAGGKYEITDIRRLSENDLRFLSQGARLRILWMQNLTCKTGVRP